MLIKVLKYIFKIFQMTAYPVESPESSNSARNEDIKEHEPFLRKEVKDTQEIPPTMRHEDKFIAEARRNG